LAGLFAADDRAIGRILIGRSGARAWSVSGTGESDPMRLSALSD